MTAAQRERSALVETMRSLGPDAPTLCGDWTTRDLAAHLVVRERRPGAAAGGVGRALRASAAQGRRAWNVGPPPRRVRQESTTSRGRPPMDSARRPRSRRAAAVEPDATRPGR